MPSKILVGLLIIKSLSTKISPLKILSFSLLYLITRLFILGKAEAKFLLFNFILFFFVFKNVCNLEGDLSFSTKKENFVLPVIIFFVLLKYFH